MNYKKLVFMGLLSISFFQLQALSFFGKTDLSNTTVKNDSVTVNGRFTFENLIIEGSLNSNGHVTGKGLHVDTIGANGKVDIQDVTAKECKINGKTDIKNGKFFLLCVNGNCYLKDIVVSEKLKVAGRLVAKNLKVSDLFLRAQSSVLENVIIEKDFFVDDSDISYSLSDLFCNSWLGKYFCSSYDKKSKTTEIELKGSSHIKGNIEFKDGNGILYCSKTVKIDGKIIGAKIIKR